MPAQTEGSGLQQFLKWGTYPGSAASGGGTIEDGDITGDPGYIQIMGIGGNERIAGGLCAFTGGAQFPLTSANQQLARYGLRSSYPKGTLQELIFEAGAENWSEVHSRAVIQTVDVNWTAKDPLKAGITWGAMLRAEGSGGDEVEDTSEPFSAFDFTLSFNGVEYGIQSLKVQIGNSVTFFSSGDTKTNTQRRWPTHYIIGPETVKLALQVGRPIPGATLDSFGDRPTTGLTALLTGNNGTNTFSLAFANLRQADPRKFGFVAQNAQHLWDHGFSGSSRNGTVTWGWS